MAEKNNQIFAISFKSENIYHGPREGILFGNKLLLKTMITHFSNT